MGRNVPVEIRCVRLQNRLGQSGFTDLPRSAYKNHFLLQIMEDLFVYIPCLHAPAIYLLFSLKSKYSMSFFDLGLKFRFIEQGRH